MRSQTQCAVVVFLLSDDKFRMSRRARMPHEPNDYLDRRSPALGSHERAAPRCHRQDEGVLRLNIAVATTRSDIAKYQPNIKLYGITS